MINALVRDKITVTAVLTAAHGNDAGAAFVMRNLANRTKGRFYNVTNPKALPRIYQKETAHDLAAVDLRAANTLAAQDQFSQRADHRTVGRCSPITGLVLTSLKENELVEVPIVSPLPTGQVNPVLAHWTYGLGRSVAFTPDAGRRWAKAWPDWSSYAAFWSQIVRWSMRPVDPGNLTLTVKRDQGRIKVVVNALDKENQFLNFLQVRGNVVNPDLKGAPIELSQTAPGKYEATFDAADSSGNYFVNLGYRGPDGVQGIISSGVSVPYSDEYRELRSNPANLETLATVTNGATTFMKTLPDGRADLRRTVDSVDHFRRDPTLVNPRGFSDLWPTLLSLAALLFLADVAVRRIAPDVDRIRKSVSNQWQKLRGKEVSSIAATAGLPDRTAYSASKGAIYSLTLAMATDHIRENIRVNCVNPGTADTPWIGRLLAAADDPVAERAALNARQPSGRLVTADEVAAGIAYLASPLASGVTGTSLAVDCGMDGLRVRPQKIG